MKILLFDCMLDGHHAEYASYLIAFFLKSGDDTIFATCGDPQDLTVHQDVRTSSRFRTVALRQTQVKGPGQPGTLHTYQDLRSCRRLAEAERVDVFHHLYLEGAELAWLAISSRSQRKWRAFATLFWLHYQRRPGAARGLQFLLKPLVKRRAFRFLLSDKRLDGLFVHSKRAHDSITSLFGRRLVNGTVTVVPDPVPDQVIVSPTSARKKLGLPENGPVLLFFGGLRRDKGPDLFLTALRFLRGSWLAVVAGQPASVSEHEIRELVSKLPDPSRVMLRLGFIEAAEVGDYFAAADAVVLPYRDSFRGTSGVLARGAAAAKPLVATDVGDIGEIIRTNRLGIVVSGESPQAFASGLHSFLANKKQVENEVTHRAKAYALENGWEVMARTTRETYLRALEIGGREADGAQA